MKLIEQAIALEPGPDIRHDVTPFHQSAKAGLNTWRTGLGSPLISAHLSSSHCAGGLHSGAHDGILLRRGARLFLLVLTLEKLNVNFRAVDANEFAAPVGEPSRR
jgi:hypothetical protein